MSVATVTSSLSAINMLSTMLFRRDRVGEEYATCDIGFHVIKHTDHDFELVETTGDLWSAKTFRNAGTH